MFTAALPLFVAVMAVGQDGNWNRVRVGETPLSLETSSPLVEAEASAGLAMYSRATEVKAWQLKLGSLDFAVQAFPKTANPEFNPKRAMVSAEALSRSVYRDRLSPEFITHASSQEGGMQIEELLMAVEDAEDAKKRVAYGYLAGWDGEWGFVARYSFEQKDLATAQRLVSSRRVLDSASGLFRFQTGVPGLRFLVPMALGSGVGTNLHNPEWFDDETTYEATFEGLTLRFTELHAKKTAKVDLVLVEKALKWQAEAQRKRADVKDLKAEVERAPLAGQQVVRATMGFGNTAKRRSAQVYGMTVSEGIWCLIALYDADDAKAAAAAKRVWESAKVIQGPPAAK